MSAVHHHFQVGAFQCSAIYDGGHMGSADFLFANAPSEELQAVLEEWDIDAGQIPSSWVCLFVDTGDKKVLLDTGIGSGAGAAGGQLMGALHSLGVPADDVDLVILTHGHPDHIGGCTDEKGHLLYPNSRFVMAQDEWDFWTSEDNLARLGDPFARFARKNLPPLEERLELVEGDSEILAGMRLLALPGHTPGHMGLELSSNGEKLFCLVDAVLHPIHIERPEWCARVDLNPDQVVSTRYRILEKVASENALALCFHFDFPALGYVTQEGSRWRWQRAE